MNRPARRAIVAAGLAVKAGGNWGSNHSEAQALRVRTSVKAGGNWGSNHSEAQAMRVRI